MFASIFSDELHDNDTRRCLATFADWGLTHCDLRGRVFGKPVHALDEDELRELRALLDEHGLRVGALQSSLAKVHLPEAERRAAEAEKLEGLIRAADLLDCRLVRSFNYWQPGRDGELAGALAQRPDELQAVLDAFAPLAERARAAGLVLAFENCGQTTEEVHALLDALDVPEWGLAWDPYNEWSCSVARERDEVGYLVRHAARSRMLHVKAAGILPELGEPLPWDRILATALASGLAGPVSIETHNPPDSPLDHVAASRRSLEATRRAWPGDTPSDAREAATPRAVPRVERAWADEPVGFVVVGLGMGANRARMISDTVGCRLLGVCDRNAELAARVGAKLDVPWTQELAPWLEDPAVEAVFVVTETGNHAAVACEAIAAGRHVITTKPMEADLAACRRMIAAADEAGVALAVDFSRRFDARLVALQDGLRSQALGCPLHATYQLKIWRDQAYFAKNGAWHGTWRLDGGGAFTNQGVHHVDELVACFGLPERVRCDTWTQRHAIECEDLGVATWRYADGLVVQLLATTTWRAGGWYRRLEIAGEDGCYLVQDGGPEPAHEAWWRGGEWRPGAPGDARPDWLNSADNLAAHLRSGAALVCDGREGARSRLILDAMYRSAAADGAWIALADLGAVDPVVAATVP